MFVFESLIQMLEKLFFKIIFVVIFTICYDMDLLSPYDDVIKWKHFPRHWPFVRGIHRWIPSQRPVTRSFEVFFDLRLNKRLSKQ